MGDVWSLLVYVATFVFPLLGLVLLYWVVRLAVRHGIRDAGLRRPD